MGKGTGHDCQWRPVAGYEWRTARGCPAQGRLQIVLGPLNYRYTQASDERWTGILNSPQPRYHFYFPKDDPTG